jgi:hypothetical protein
MNQQNSTPADMYIIITLITTTSHICSGTIRFEKEYLTLFGVVDSKNWQAHKHPEHSPAINRIKSSRRKTWNEYSQFLERLHTALTQTLRGQQQPTKRERVNNKAVKSHKDTPDSNTAYARA